MSRLTGKVAVVTGASRGIGAAIATALASDGAAVTVGYASSQAGADSVVADIARAGGNAIAVQVDVSKPDQADVLIAATMQAFGRLDIVVNNAGIFEPAPIEAFTEEHYRRIFDVNVLGALSVTRAAVRHLGEGGSVINVSSNVTTGLWPRLAVYAGSKAAMDAVTGVLAKELGPRHIRVNAINPGLVETDGSDAGLGADERKNIVAQTPLGRAGTPDDIAALAVFLASDDARWLTGERLLATGGLR